MNKISVLIMFIFIFINTIALAGPWDSQIRWPGDDPLWLRTKKLWSNHWDGENINDIIANLHVLEERYPEKIESYLWSGKAYYLKAWWDDMSYRGKNLKKSIAYAAKALSIDDNNAAAFRILVAALSYSSNKEYIFKKYGKLITKFSPISSGRALPELKRTREWKRALTYWDQRVDVNKALHALKIFKQIAGKNTGNGLAQLWVSRAFYYIGYYYLSEQQDEAAIKYFTEGIGYGKSALKLMPNSVEAHFWFLLNSARSLQYSSIFTKAGKAFSLMDHMIFCARENPLYFYYGPMSASGSMIAHGGWLAEKGMSMMRMKIEYTMNGLNIAGKLYPNYLYILYSKADILQALGQKEKAKAILTKLLKRNPNVNPFHGPENQCVLKIARKLLNEIE